MQGRIPTSILVLAGIGLLIAGPATVAAFIFGGAFAGGVTILAICLAFTALYIYAVRRP